MHQGDTGEHDELVRLRAENSCLRKLVAWYESVMAGAEVLLCSARTLPLDLSGKSEQGLAPVLIDIVDEEERRLKLADG